jgi:hypothetical protein
MTKKYKFLYKTPSDISNTDYHHKPNVVDCAANIIIKLIEYNEVVTVAEMQSGKTDVMKRLIYMVKNYNSGIKDLGIEIEKFNIYLVICASSIGLKNQLKTKLPEIKHRVYHLPDIKNFVNDVYGNESLLTMMSDSSLIIFDECHCDAECQKLVDLFRNALDKLAKENKTQYHKVGFSATAYEQILAGYPKVILKPSENYYGMRQIFGSLKKNSNNEIIPVIFQAKKISDPVECTKLFLEIGVLNYYYIFRLPGIKNCEDTIILNIEKEFKKRGAKISTYIYDMNYRGNINDLLDKKPLKPIVIYLKDKLRMGEYLNTKYVYVVHDDPNNTFTHTTAQSLLGRCCGYDKQSHHTIIYCDFEKAYQHYKWIINGYDIAHIPYDAKYIKKSTRETKEICIY